MKRILLLLSIVLLASCGNSKNSKEFITAVSGTYLFNANETVGITFNEEKLNVRWRGKENIEPLKVNDSTFYIQEMNEKFIFVMQPKVHILLAQKREHNGATIKFPKMLKDQKTPNEYFKDNQIDKALEGYMLIKKNNPDSRSVREGNLNSLGYRALRKKEYKKAIKIFKLNTVLHPKSANAFDSLGEAYHRSKDSANAIISFKKTLELNPKSKRAKQYINEQFLD
jgi:tetratricopeptide (TPR) repeat protein